MTWGHSRQPIGVRPCLSPSRLEGGLQRLALVPWPPVALSRNVQCSLLLAPHHLVVGLAWNLFYLLSGDTWPSPWPLRLHTSSLGLHVACPPQAWAVHHMSSFCPRKHGLRAGDTPPPPAAPQGCITKSLRSGGLCLPLAAPARASLASLKDKSCGRPRPSCGDRRAGAQVLVRMELCLLAAGGWHFRLGGGMPRVTF